MSDKKKCSKCKRESTFDSPALLCDLHWQLWAMEKYDGTPDELYKICEKDLQYTWERFGRPDEADEMLKEAAEFFGVK